MIVVCLCVLDLPHDSLGARSFIDHGIDVMNLPAFLRAFIRPLVPCEPSTDSGLLSTGTEKFLYRTVPMHSTVYHSVTHFRNFYLSDADVVLPKLS